MTGWRRPRWWAVLLTVAGALLFVALGVWQLDRARQKEQLLRRYATAAKAAPEPLSRALARGADTFAHVRVRGVFLADRVYLLDNPRHDRRGGVEVYVPLRRARHDRLLLVDLGFVAAPAGATHTEATPPLPPLPSGEVKLHGLYLPPPGSGLEMGGDALGRQPRWPKKTIYLDLAQVAHDLGRPLYPRVLALDAEPASAYRRKQHYDFSSMPPARHRAYAFQWFGLAAAVLAIFAIRHRRRHARASTR